MMNPRELALKHIRAQLVKVESECTYSLRGETGRLIEKRLEQISSLIEEIFDIQKHDIDIMVYIALMNQDQAPPITDWEGQGVSGSAGALALITEEQR